MPISQVMVNAVVKGASFSQTTQVTSLLQNRKTVQEALSNLVSQLPLMDFTHVHKNRFLTREWEEGRVKRLPNKMDNA